MVSYVQSLLANFVSAYYRIITWPPQKKKKKSASSCFQHLSVKFVCFGFDLTQSQSSKPISRNGYGSNWRPFAWSCFDQKRLVNFTQPLGEKVKNDEGKTLPSS